MATAKRRKLNDSSDDAELHTEDNLQEQLRQFDVLDEVHGDDSGSDASEGKIMFIVIVYADIDDVLQIVAQVNRI